VKSLNRRQNEKGTTMAEFAIVALLFFTIIFGIIEFGRLLYTHNALTDATRRGARFASLHDGGSGDAVKNEVVYGSKATKDEETGAITSPPLINGLTTDMVTVTYAGIPLGVDGSGESGYGTNLGTATVTIDGYQFDLLIPVIGRRITLPAYSTTSSAESAGATVAPITTTP
jgi:Flp pilus assembly protein TadG